MPHKHQNQQQPPQPRPPHYHEPSWKSDTLTGVSLTDAQAQGVQHIMRVRDYDASRDENDRAPIPYTIHSRRMDTASGSRAARRGDYGGGLAFSGAFLTYAGKVQPTATQQEHMSCWNWWKVPYVRERVLQTFSSERDQRAIAAILAFRRDKRELRAACVAHGFPGIPSVMRIERRIVRYAKRTFGLQGEIGPETQTWRAAGADAAGAPLVNSLLGDANLSMTPGEVAG